MPEQDTPKPNASSPPPKSASPSSYVPPSPGRTQADIISGGVAFETARLERKLARCDRDLERHRARMHAAADAQAEAFGADLSPAEGGGEQAESTFKGALAQAGMGEDEMEVLTNSPVTITHNPAPVVVAEPSWSKGKTLAITTAIMGGALVLWALIQQINPPPAAPPVPDPPPVVAPGDLHIRVIPGDETPR